ncbi:hypothetical protein [Gulosibacter hominis]|uniref:hypothetical protein n=1 Tax=Gulosibacter hominis TaxID=2770504 RepID=UPI0019194D43|nr:hypothetical protein [Gulosibacter hominis]
MTDDVHVLLHGTLAEMPRQRRGICRARVQVSMHDGSEPVEQLIVGTGELAPVIAAWTEGQAVFVRGVLTRDDDLPPTDARAWAVEARHVGAEQLPEVPST